jgi:hypothetical protein
MIKTQEELLTKLLINHIFLLDQRIREADNLSKPCPEGRWRWADMHLDGYRKKNEHELAADRRRNEALADELRLERTIARAALRDIAPETKPGE